MGSDSNEPVVKEASLNISNSCSQPLCWSIWLKKLAAMNTMKTELRQFNLAIIITVDTMCSSAGRAYFDKSFKSPSVCTSSLRRSCGDSDE